MIEKLRIFFLSLLFGLICFNSYQLILNLTPNRPIAFTGIKFAGLSDVLKNETHIGYITDFDLKDDRNLAEYEQAQYMLAPAILEHNNSQTRFLIINCSTDTASFQKLKELGAQPLKRNQFGVILAVNFHQARFLSGSDNR